jgi:hypothetical protein
VAQDREPAEVVAFSGAPRLLSHGPQCRGQSRLNRLRRQLSRLLNEEIWLLWRGFAQLAAGNCDGILQEFVCPGHLEIATRLDAPALNLDGTL